MRRFLILVPLALGACGARTQTSSATPPPGTTDAGPDAAFVNPQLDGHWMQNAIGNCINAEDWLEFRGPTGFVHTLVDRDYCGPHSVRRAEGSMSVLPERVVSYSFATPFRAPTYTRTSIVLDPVPPGTFAPNPPPDPPYAYGQRAFVPFAFSRNAGGTYVRTDITKDGSGTGPVTLITSVTSELTVTPAPVSAKPGDACMIHLVMVASVSYDTDPTPKTVTFDFACEYANELSGWLGILPKGKKPDDVSGFWYDLLQTKNVAKLGHAGDALRAGFFPHLIRVPAQPDVLVMPRGWYREMLQPPPTSVK